jgi:hypothetical protein
VNHPYRTAAAPVPPRRLTWWGSLLCRWGRHRWYVAERPFHYHWESPFATVERVWRCCRRGCEAQRREELPHAVYVSREMSRRNEWTEQEAIELRYREGRTSYRMGAAS